MGDSTLWVAALTAATAVLASWVTSRGTARAARIQADAAAATVQADGLRAARRSAYVDLIEQAQRMGDLYWKVTDAHEIGDPDERLATLRDLRIRLRGEYAVLRQRVWVADLEGPPEVASAADLLRRSTSANYRALDAMIMRRGGQPADGSTTATPRSGSRSSTSSASPAPPCTRHAYETRPVVAQRCRPRAADGLSADTGRSAVTRGAVTGRVLSLVAALYRGHGDDRRRHGPDRVDGPRPAYRPRVGDRLVADGRQAGPGATARAWLTTAAQ